MWEYKLVMLPLSVADIGFDEVEHSLNAEGAAGWELVAVVPKISPMPSLDCLAFMKRLKK